MMAPPSWAYQAENFVPPADEELICSICRAIFCDPVQCPCGHVFCRACISKWLQTNKNCPVCRKRATRSSLQDVVPLLKNIILKLILRCKNFESGCMEMFSLEACEHHMKLCVYEMVKCRNQSCSEQHMRKEIAKHERKECLFRCVKCTSCCLNISELTSKKHCCISELKKALKEKESTIEERNKFIKLQEEKIQQLQAEIKSLKDADRDTDTSSVESISAADVMISVADLSRFSSDSSLSVSDSEDDDDGFREWFNTPAESSSATGDAQPLEESREEQNFQIDSPLLNFSGDAHVSGQSNSREENLQGSMENPRASSPWNDMFDAFVQSPAVEIDNSLPLRRPNKRRHAVQTINNSDLDNSDEDLPSLRSPKRCWRMNSDEEQSPSNSRAAESVLPIDNQPSNYFMEAGPSFRIDSIVDSSESSNSASRSRISSSKLRPKFNKRNQNSLSTASTPESSNSVSAGHIFERTVKLLKRYNLESDPEWKPEFSSHRGNDTTSDSDESVGSPPFIQRSEDSSWSDIDESSDESTRTADLISGIFESSDDDEEWHPH